MRFAYADPPYPGLAHYYKDQPLHTLYVFLSKAMRHSTTDGAATHQPASTLTFSCTRSPSGRRTQIHTVSGFASRCGTL